MRNPGLEIAGARRKGSSRHIVVTFAEQALPKHVRFWASAFIVHPFRERIEACFNCRRIGHRSDVCPDLRRQRCRRCGDEKHETPPRGAEAACKARCIICRGGHPTGAPSCRYRFYAFVQRKKSAREGKKESATTSQTAGPPASGAQNAFGTGTSGAGTSYRDAVRHSRPSVRSDKREASNSRSGSRQRSRSSSQPRNCSNSKQRSDQAVSRKVAWSANPEPKPTPTRPRQDANQVRELAEEIQALRQQLEAISAKIRALESRQPIGGAPMTPAAREVVACVRKDELESMEAEPTKKTQSVSAGHTQGV